MTDDVKRPLATEAPASPATPQGSDEPVAPAPEAPKAPEATPEAPSAEGPKTVSLEEHENLQKALKAERRKLRKLRRGSQERSGTQPVATDDKEAEIAYLKNQVAISQLEKGAAKLVKEYPELPEHIKRAILRNPRGYVKATATNVDEGLDDIEEYIEEEMDLLEEASPSKEPSKKEVLVAGTNTPETAKGSTPAEIQAILDTPVSEWTPEQKAALKEFRASHT